MPNTDSIPLTPERIAAIKNNPKARGIIRGIGGEGGRSWFVRIEARKNRRRMATMGIFTTEYREVGRRVRDMGKNNQNVPSHLLNCSLDNRTLSNG